MTATATAIDTPIVRPPFERSTLVIAGIRTIVLAALGGVWGLHRDEFYYLAGGRRLAWGYVDHPPLTPFLYRVTDVVFGSSQFALHASAAVVSSAVVVAATLLARELGGGRVAQLLTALGVAVSPMLMTTGHFLSTVTLDILFWSLGALFLVRLLRTGDTRWWVAIGAIAGLGLLNKHTMLFWGFGAIVGLLCTPQRTLLRSGWLVVGALVAAALFAPNLVWEAQHGWPTVEFLRSLQSHTDFISNRALYFPIQLVLSGPLLALFWVPGLVWLLRGRGAAGPFRALGFGFIAVDVLVFVLHGKAYYPGSWAPALFAAGGVAIEAASRRPVRWYVTLFAVAALTSAPFALPLVPATSPPAKTVVAANGELGEMLGWDDLAQQVATIAHGLPADDQARLTILTSNYSEAGAIEYRRDQLALPQPISPQNSYWLWGYGAAQQDGTVLAIGFDRSELAPFFADVEPVATVTNAEGIHNKELGAPILVCRGQTVPWDALWPRLKNFS